MEDILAGEEALLAEEWGDGEDVDDEAVGDGDVDDSEALLTEEWGQDDELNAMLGEIDLDELAALPDTVPALETASVPVPEPASEAPPPPVPSLVEAAELQEALLQAQEDLLALQAEYDTLKVCETALRSHMSLTRVRASRPSRASTIGSRRPRCGLRGTHRPPLSMMRVAMRLWRTGRGCFEVST